MWMHVARSRMDPARMDEDNTLIEDVTEAHWQLPGFQRFVLSADRTKGVLIGVSTFDTQEHAHWTRTREDLNARIQALGMQLDPPEIFEVTAKA